MAKHFEENQIVEGKVTGIQSYGAFVALDENTEGLVHISEVTHGFVKDIHDHLSVGDQVKVKILKIDEEEGKYSLSIRATTDHPKQTKKQKQQPSKDKTSAGFNTMRAELQQWLEQSNFQN